MKCYPIIFLLFILSCIPPPESIEQPTTPEIIKISQLPPMKDNSQIGVSNLTAIFLIHRDGTVGDVKLISTTGDSEWDNAAIDSLRTWRFTSVPDDIAVRYRLRIELEEPIYLHLGQLIVSSREEADSLYKLLRKGTDFIDLARHIREEIIEGNGSFYELVNTARYPEQVRKELQKLRVNQYTKPIRVGDTYVIYKRFDDRKKNS